MADTDKTACRILAELLTCHGVSRAVMSPGSRNLPLLIALGRSSKIVTDMVVDERTAAFAALGMAVATGKPVALACTSGSALLNYAPAVAEAYYRHIPLIIVSADRPAEWIDQDDSQTIRQAGALANIVKRSYDIPDNCTTPVAMWYANRQINDALIEAQRGCRGPVHINIQLSEPLNRLTDEPLPAEAMRMIEMPQAHPCIDDSRLDELRYAMASSDKTMVIAGFMQPDPMLAEALTRIAAMPNVAVLTESISNQHVDGAIECIDLTVSGIHDDMIDSYRPDTVITLGGALVSRYIKQLLRNHPPRRHWHVGHTPVTVDCLQSLTMRIDMNPADLFARLSSTIITDKAAESSYRALWQSLYARRIARRNRIVAALPWCDLAAFSEILPRIPAHCDLQLSNGTPIRYAQLLADLTSVNRADCNRGVSGIDGSTSTAIGAAMASGIPTLLITGDMSAQYDMGAMALRGVPSSFRMIVIDNGGGGIFRFIASTSGIAERERLFGDPVNMPVAGLAAAFGWDFH
ncbi:MAG: 2-succinyl-5-enolpyruvyl-6-hydroxy-3-cyclohexene-1-carboxylic-acid synthase, partial [Muribaculaceae bacterium]|nr:2-succinyl-5-enolpyruvyl-6-hydroxy-3-cyclohexene-1-carboxylic-acid synthase [Muribaculaceae bacterium]